MPVVATSVIFGKAILAMLNKEIDWNSDNIMVALFTNSLVPNQDTMDYYNDLSNEVSSNGTGYTTGGFALGTPTISYNASTKTIKLDGNDISIPNAIFTARYAVVYDASPGSAAANPVIGYIDFGEDKSPNNVTFSITWDTAGIFTFTVPSAA